MGLSKKELLKMLEDAIYLEEKSIPVYKRHIKTALFWSGLPAAERRRLDESLNMLAAESEEHARRIEGMRDRIAKDVRDVF